MRPLVLVFLVGCNGTDLIAPNGVAANCGANAPVITDVEIEEGDPFDLGGEIVPGLFINTLLTDVDGDLHWYEMRLWWDDVIDGAVAPEGFYYEAYGARGDVDCGVEATEIPVRIAVSGAPPVDTDVEFGVVVYDDMLHPSNDGTPFVVEFRTPE